MMSLAANNKTDSADNMNVPITLILMVICIVGVGGNAIVLGVGFFKRKYQNNVTNCYIMNLAITDLLFLLISVPLTIYLGIRKLWIFGEFMCKMHIYIAHVLLQATCYTLAAMSIDRYLNTIHWRWYRRYRQTKYTLIICILIWTISSVFMFPYDYLLRMNVEKHNESSDISDCTVHDESSLFSSCLFTFGIYYVLPLLIMSLCYSRLSSHVRNSRYRVSKQLSTNSRQSVKLKSRRLQRMLLGLTLAFALCWLPIHILELLYCSELLSISFYVKHVHFLTAARVIAHGLSYFNSCLNPLLYALLNKSYFSDNR